MILLILYLMLSQYFLGSFLKIYVKVQKKLFRVRRSFLFGGVNEVSKNYRIKRDNVCKHKSKGVCVTP